jgi:hypothetical protein
MEGRRDVAVAQAYSGPALPQGACRTVHPADFGQGLAVQGEAEISGHLADCQQAA